MYFLLATLVKIAGKKDYAMKYYETLPISPIIELDAEDYSFKGLTKSQIENIIALLSLLT